MKWLIALLVSAFLSLDSAAADFHLTPKHTPQPGYPESLRGSRQSGRVKVQYRNRADGAVTDLIMLESTHPAFSEEVQRALAGWEYYPWAVDGENPSTLEVVLPIVFTGSAAESREIRRAHARSLHCIDLVRERAQYVGEHPWADEVQMESFQHVRKELNRALVSGAVSYQRHLAMVEQFEKAWPEVLAACEEQPQKLFTDLLPTPIHLSLEMPSS